jgi:hypothetical protein
VKTTDNLADIFKMLTLDNQALLLTCAQVASAAEEAGHSKGRDEGVRGEDEVIMTSYVQCPQNGLL